MLPSKRNRLASDVTASAVAGVVMLGINFLLFGEGSVMITLAFFGGWIGSLFHYNEQ